MENHNSGGVHWSFWAIGVFALIWNVMGVVNYFVQMDPEMLDAYRASERAIISGRPAWATGAFAIAVFGGSVGCVLLLWRKSAAFYLFVVSLIGTIGAIAHALGVDISFGTGEIIGIVFMPLALSAFLIWYSKHTVSKGWLT